MSMQGYLLEQKKDVLFHYETYLPRIRKPVSFYKQTRTISLLCPISNVRQRIPVRTETCTHAATFDLENMVYSMTLNDFLRKKLAKIYLKDSTINRNVAEAFKCPICDDHAALYIDEVVVDALDSLPDSVSLFTVDEQGNNIAAEPPLKNQFFSDLEVFDDQQNKVARLLSPLGSLPNLNSSSNICESRLKRKFSFLSSSNLTIPGVLKYAQPVSNQSRSLENGIYFDQIMDKCATKFCCNGEQRYRRLSTVASPY